jgi:hypothetical protein
MRTPLLAAAATLVVMALYAAPAGADTFKGSCHITGVATFGHNLTGTPGDNTYDFHSGSPDGTKSDGTKCTGQLNGRQGDYFAVATVAGSGTLSCGASHGEGGTGSLLFPDTHSVFPFGFQFAGAGTEVAFNATYSDGKSSPGHASFAAYAPPNQATVETCNGAGFKSLGFDADLFDSGNTINGYNTAPPSSGGPSSYAAGPNSGYNTGPQQQTGAKKSSPCSRLKGAKKTKCARRAACMKKRGRKRSQCLAALNRKPGHKKH